MDNDFSKVKLSKLEQITKSIRKELKVKNGDVEIPMEYIISALFPDAYDNIKKAMAQEFIRGYNEGKNSILGDESK